MERIASAYETRRFTSQNGLLRAPKRHETKIGLQPVAHLSHIRMYGQ